MAAGLLKAALFALSALALSIKLDMTGVAAGAVVAVLLLASYMRGRLRAASAFLLGVLLPLAPAFGSGTLLFLCYFIFMCTSAFVMLARGAWMLPFFSIVAVHAMAGAWYGFDAAPFLAADLGTAFSRLRSSPPLWYPGVEGLLRLGAVILLYARFADDENGRGLFLRGVAAGMAGAFAALVYQWLLGVYSFDSAQQSYWQAQGRFAASFTDPNAFGVFSVLLLPFAVIAMRLSSGVLRIAAAAAAVLIVGGALMSGSRTFILGLAILCLLAAPGHGRRLAAWGFGAAVVVVVLMNIADLYMRSAFEQLYANLPVTLQRTAATLLVSHIDSATFSRLSFLELGIAIWRDHPLLGAGYMSFRQLVLPYSAMLGLQMGLWADNANNFYLGMLAELGLAGGAAFIAVILGAKLRPDGGVIGAASVGALIILGVLLILGPHTEFDEVALLSGFLLACAVVPRGTAWRRSSIAVFVILLVIVGGSRQFSERGFYSWELDGASYMRWTGRQAFSSVACTGGERAHVRIRALNPDIAARPLTVTLRPWQGAEQRLTLHDNAVRELQLECAALSLGKQPVWYSMETDRSWRPADFGMGADNRELGIQILSNGIPRRG